jgi:two-component system nitrate/nitrite response regulator NarP
MRILVADEQSKVRFALRVLLGQQPGLEIVGEATDSEELLAQAKAVSPDLVLVHWGLRGLVPADLLAALRRGSHDLRVVALSARPEARSAALAAGADAFVYKVDPPERLLAAIRSVGCQT